jgi:hypothetical protein
MPVRVFLKGRTSRRALNQAADELTTQESSEYHRTEDIERSSITLPVLRVR